MKSEKTVHNTKIFFRRQYKTEFLFGAVTRNGGSPISGIRNTAEVNFGGIFAIICNPLRISTTGVWIRTGRSRAVIAVFGSVSRISPAVCYGFVASAGSVA